MAVGVALSRVLDSFPSSLFFIPVLGVLVFSLWFLNSYFLLRKIPGPFLAAFSNLPRVSWILSNRAHDIHIDLHQKYGKLVRFGPNMISVGDATEIPNLYSFSGKFTKSDFYHVLLFYAKGKPVPTIFATQDEDLHRMLKKPIAGIYTMSNLMSFEPYVDTTISFFFAQLDKLFVQTGDICDLGTWLQMFAFDVMGELTFSKRLGFLERAEDVDGIMESIWHYFHKTSPISQIPWVDRLWAKNPIFQRLKAVRINPIVEFGLARIAERKSASDTFYEKESSTNSRDFLSRFLEAQTKDKSIPPWYLVIPLTPQSNYGRTPKEIKLTTRPRALTAWTTSNIAAGSDTTAILLRTTIHSLLSHTATLSCLLSELDSLPPSPFPTPVTFKQMRSLPYLDACIKEAGRLHPPFGLPLERVVPPEGATVCGENFTGGTVIGMSPWVVHRDKDVFGEDAGVWRPERWLDCDNEQRRRMEAGLLTFGAGHRACIGKNISYLEVYKLIPSLLKTYEITFAEPGCPEWRVENRWFVNQTGLNVRLKRREVGEGENA